MKLIIAGSRTISDMKALKEAYNQIKTLINITEIVTGGALGIDSLADKMARDYEIDRVIFFANWDKHKLSAGIKRNIRMANYGDALLALWDGKSSGTRNMIIEAEKRKLPSYVFLYDYETKSMKRESE